MSDIECFLAQYTPNLMRREASNVGLLLARDNEIVARFFAEITSKKGMLIQASVARKRVLHPGIYRQWVELWRYKIQSGRTGLESILNDEPSNFGIIRAGTITDLQHGTLRSLADDLYDKMVNPISDDRPDHKPQEPPLFSMVKDAFGKAAILSTGKGQELVPHPVMPHQAIEGRVAPHSVSFLQSGKTTSVMQTISLAHSMKKRSIGMSAQSAAYMFKDISANMKNVKTIALVNNDIPDGDQSIERAMSILKDAADEIINWSDLMKRSNFIEERTSIAYHAA